MTIRRVALVFDNRPRPETTGTYCFRALQELVEIRHVLPEDVAQVSPDEFDLWLRIDDGLRFPWPSTARPCAYWAIDTHLDFAWSHDQARRFDFVFAAQRDGAQRLREEGCAVAQWLPLACDPAIHHPHETGKQWDVGFVGHVLGGERERLLQLIQSRFPNCFVGQRYFEEMAQVYSASRIVFNRSVAGDLNMRVFEALACGTLLLTDDLGGNGQADLFQDGVHLATYCRDEDLIDQLTRYLEDEAARERVAEAGHREVLARHTYRHRMRTLLEHTEHESRRATGLSIAPQPLTAGPDGESPADGGARDGRGSGDPKGSTAPEASGVRPAKEASYFEFSRPEVLRLVPASARCVLDIGCGAGRLGESLKRRQPAEVVGIERDEPAARRAAERLDEVLRGDVETDEIDFPAGRFDCVICADILEHLRAPERLLEKIRRWLAPGGRLVASIPNVRHHSVVRALLAGNWTYEAAGLLDGDHVRFFTRREIEKLLDRSRLTVVDWQAVPGPGDEARRGRERSSQVAVDGFRYQGVSSEDADEFFTYQYLVVAEPAPEEDHGLTSIVIVTHNQLPYTRMCLESIRLRTSAPYELVFVDNGSTDGTVDWLRRQADVLLIENAENRGFPAAANQGVDCARGEQILLLNNDCILTTGWLRRLLDALGRDPRIALAGPCSNNVSGPQQVPVPYGDLLELDGFAWDWGRTHAGRTIDVDRLVGFCLLFRHELLETVGRLDERFGIGCFEDDDYCRRALLAGYRAVIVQDAFVHHFGSRTFLASGRDYGTILEENRRLYEQKWTAGATPQRNEEEPVEADARADVKFSLGRSPSGGLLLEPKVVRLSLCLICRDNERTIRECLESIQPWVDEMVVVDTGSADRTPEIAKELGARLFHFTWCDDFSAARNESLRHARGEWIFWMDSDDTIDAACGRRLQALAAGEHPEDVFGYVMQVHCPGPRRRGRRSHRRGPRQDGPRASRPTIRAPHPRADHPRDPSRRRPRGLDGHFRHSLRLRPV